MDKESPLSTETSSGSAESKPEESKSKPKRNKLSKNAFDLAMGFLPVAIASFAVAVLGLLSPVLSSGYLGMVAELCASVMNQAIILLLISSLPALFSKPWRIMAIGCIVVALVGVLFVSPVLDSNKKSKAEASYLSFKLVQLPLNTDVVKIDEVAKFADKLDTEIVVITDVDLAKMARLNPKMTAYHNRAEFPDSGGYGVCIYSKVPLKGSRSVKVGPDKLPVTVTTAFFEYGWVNIVGVRVQELMDGIQLPGDKEAKSFDKRNKFVEAVSEMVAKLKGPTIVCGNLGMSPYSGTYKKFLADSKLLALREGFTIKPTGFIGPADIFVNRIALDNMLVNDKVSYLDRSLSLNYKGSNHPIIGTFSVSNKDEKFVPPVVAPPPKKAQPKPPAKAAAKKKAKKKRSKKRRSRRKSRKR